MNDTNETVRLECCDGSPDCVEHLPDFVPDTFPTQLPFDRWPDMRLPPILFARWRYPKFVAEEERGRGGKGERAVKTGEGSMDVRAENGSFWPFRCERPQFRMEVSSLAWRPRYSEKVKTHRRGSTRAVVTPTERVRPFQPFASRRGRRRRRISVTF